MSYLYTEAEKAAKKCGTRDPYDLIDVIGAKLRVSYDFDPEGLKGYATILNRSKFILVNGHLEKPDQRIVAGHEATHLILHKADILRSPVSTLRDFNLFSNTGRLESQANRFLADFLVSDLEVLNMASDEAYDFFSAACELSMPPPLFAFKLWNMIQRGHKIQSPIDLDSRFLAGGRDGWSS